MPTCANPPPSAREGTASRTRALDPARLRLARVDDEPESSPRPCWWAQPALPAIRSPHARCAPLHRRRRADELIAKDPLASHRLRARPADHRPDGLRGPAQAQSSGSLARRGDDRRHRPGRARDDVPHAARDPPLSRVDGRARPRLCAHVRSSTTARERCGPRPPTRRTSKRRIAPSRLRDMKVWRSRRPRETVRRRSREAARRASDSRRRRLRRGARTYRREAPHRSDRRAEATKT
jgi:hypothetical protein